MSKPVGCHLIADMRTDDVGERKKFQDLSLMQTLLGQAAEAAGATCLKIEGHKFGDGQGVTAFAMLAESHISVHSWPEHGFLAIDIFMCGSSTSNIRQALGVFKTQFSNATFEEKFIERDYMGNGT